MKSNIRILFASLILFFALIACGDAASNSGAVVTGTTTATSAPAASHFKTGQVVKVGDTWEVTVNSIKKSQGDEFSKPDSGNMFLIVNVTVKNISAKEQTISSLLNFKLKDADGTEGKTNFLSGTSPAPDGKIAAGDKSRGDLVYEVSASQKNFTLAFESDIFSSGQVIWDLSI
ncbi:MAG TPA: DUF4352 domain-containing protein [Ktedonobacteraceae bacterium]|nr:DUF4352 domain-containing protein [Ktedonobacteraceae bacterium]